MRQTGKTICSIPAVRAQLVPKFRIERITRGQERGREKYLKGIACSACVGACTAAAAIAPTEALRARAQTKHAWQAAHSEASKQLPTSALLRQLLTAAAAAHSAQLLATSRNALNSYVLVTSSWYLDSWIHHTNASWVHSLDSSVNHHMEYLFIFIMSVHYIVWLLFFQWIITWNYYYLHSSCLFITLFHYFTSYSFLWFIEIVTCLVYFFWLLTLQCRDLGPRA